MISRLSTLATVFAVLATASLGYAASLPQASGHAATAAAAKPVRVVQLERVVVTAKRLPQAAV
jgi:hypothetical protein